MGQKTDIRTNAGFTLIELTVVLVVLGVIGLVTLPRLFDRGAFDELGFSEELIAATRYAQRFAVASGCEVQVQLQASRYDLFQRQNSCTSGNFSRAVIHPAKGGNFSAVAPASVTVTSTPSSFVFDAMGRASSDVSISVGGRSFQVIAETGAVVTP